SSSTIHCFTRIGIFCFACIAVMRGRVVASEGTCVGTLKGVGIDGRIMSYLIPHVLIGVIPAGRIKTWITYLVVTKTGGRFANFKLLIIVIPVNVPSVGLAESTNTLRAPESDI